MIRAEGRAGVAGLAEVGLEVAIGKLVGALDHHRRFLEERIPKAVKFHGTVVGPASGNALILPRPSGPGVGYVWHVRAWRVSTNNPAADTPNGSIFAYVGHQPAIAGGGQADVAESWVDRSSTAFPVVAFYEDYQVTVHAGEHIYFLVTSPASGTNYTVTGNVKEELEAVAFGRETYPL